MKRNRSELVWLIREVAEGDMLLDMDAIRRLSDQLDIQLCDRGFFCVVAQYADTAAVLTDAGLPMALYNACISAAKNLENDTYCYTGTGFCVVMVVSDEGKGRSDAVKKLYNSIAKQCALPIQLGIGRVYRDIEKLSYSRVEAYEAVGSIAPTEKISYIDDIYVMRSITTRKLESEKRKVIELFKAGQLTQMMESLEQLAENVRTESPVREGMPYPTSIRRTVVELLFEIMHVGADAGLDVDELLNYQDPYTRVFSIQGTPGILSWFYDVAQTLYSSISEMNSRTENNMLSIAKKCIDEHIADPDLSLSLVSDALGITPTYFSAFFIREVGMGFNEYITGLRMEQAKLLLGTTNKKISDIAIECGFRSASYFIVVFRKQTGMSPGEFRNKKK